MRARPRGRTHGRDGSVKRTGDSTGHPSRSIDEQFAVLLGVDFVRMGVSGVLRVGYFFLFVFLIYFLRYSKNYVIQKLCCLRLIHI